MLHMVDRTHLVPDWRSSIVEKYRVQYLLWHFQDQVEIPNGNGEVISGNQLDAIPEQPEQGEQRSVLSRFGLQVPGFSFQRFQ